jgi:hypothetical protein
VLFFKEGDEKGLIYSRVNFWGKELKLTYCLGDSIKLGPRITRHL